MCAETGRNTDPRDASELVALIQYGLRNVTESAVAIPFPLVCPVCGGTRESANAIACHACRISLGTLQQGLCPHCRRYRTFSDTVCDECGTDQIPRSVAVVALLDSAWRDIVHAFKYRGDQSLAQPLGALMAESLPGGLSVDAVIPVPTEKHKQRERGYGHAELLAETIGGHFDTPVYEGALERTRRTKDQTRLSGDQRRANLRGAFRVSANCDVNTQSILLVDDITTTGATLSEASRALNDAGATSILAVVLCLNLGIVSDGV
ncbi:MAG: hypothetical protein GF341_09205 [candidate division Zixibacteria bacterium]|nr:hypothetical protein [candidate division Zixibacteria bacterium]